MVIGFEKNEMQCNRWRVWRVSQRQIPLQFLFEEALVEKSPSKTLVQVVSVLKCRNFGERARIYWSNEVSSGSWSATHTESTPLGCLHSIWNPFVNISKYFPRLLIYWAVVGILFKSGSFHTKVTSLSIIPRQGQPHWCLANSIYFLFNKLIINNHI